MRKVLRAREIGKPALQKRLFLLDLLLLTDADLHGLDVLKRFVIVARDGIR